MPDKKKELGICPILHAALLIAGLRRKDNEEGPSGKCLGDKCEAWSKFNGMCGLKLTK